MNTVIHVGYPPRTFPGAFVFNLKATHGFPLDFAIDRLAFYNMEVEWPSFIEAAREGGWWDFQTYEAIVHAMEDAQVHADARERVKVLFQRYVLQHPHPRMDLTDLSIATTPGASFSSDNLKD